MNPSSLCGTITALITPMRAGAIDLDALDRHVDRQLEASVDGLVPCGTTGEASTLDEEERRAVIARVARRAAGRALVIAGTGSNDTRRTIEATKRAGAIEGVDAALVVCPYYNRPDQAGMIAHFERVAEQGGLPIVLYNVPSRTGVSLAPDSVARLAAHDQIVGIKDATGDMSYLTALLERLDRDAFALLSGDDFSAAPFIALGGHGAISVASNIVPGRVGALIRAARAGERDAMRSAHLALQPLARLLFARPSPAPAKALGALLGWWEDEVRAPLAPWREGFDQAWGELASRYPELEGAL